MFFSSRFAQFHPNCHHFPGPKLSSNCHRPTPCQGPSGRSRWPDNRAIPADAKKELAEWRVQYDKISNRIANSSGDTGGLEAQKRKLLDEAWSVVDGADLETLLDMRKNATKLQKVDQGMERAIKNLSNKQRVASELRSNLAGGISQLLVSKGVEDEDEVDGDSSSVTTDMASASVTRMQTNLSLLQRCTTASLLTFTLLSASGRGKGRERYGYYESHTASTITVKFHSGKPCSYELKLVSGLKVHEDTSLPKEVVQQPQAQTQPPVPVAAEGSGSQSMSSDEAVRAGLLKRKRDEAPEAKCDDVPRVSSNKDAPEAVQHQMSMRGLQVQDQQQPEETPVPELPQAVQGLGWAVGPL